VIVCIAETSLEQSALVELQIFVWFFCFFCFACAFFPSLEVDAHLISLSM
jgi:hypothetical protein